MTALNTMSRQLGPTDGEQADDATLISAVRCGDMSAYEGLYQRHLAAAYNLARQLGRCRADINDLVSEAFARVLATLRSGGGPDSAFRAYLLTALRHVAYDKTRRDRRTDLTDDVMTAPGVSVEEISQPFQDTIVSELDSALAAHAFARLPKRWQAALWYTEIEGKSPTETARLLGLTANGVSALAYRAREGLRQAYLQAHLTRVVDRCRATTDQLGPWLRGKVARREANTMEAHLADCARCHALATELTEVSDGLVSGAAVRYLAATARHSVGTSTAAHRTVGDIGGGPRSQRSWLPCSRAYERKPR